METQEIIICQLIVQDMVVLDFKHSGSGGEQQLCKFLTLKKIRKSVN